MYLNADGHNAPDAYTSNINNAPEGFLRTRRYKFITKGTTAETVETTGRSSPLSTFSVITDFESLLKNGCNLVHSNLKHFYFSFNSLQFKDLVPLHHAKSKHTM